MSRLSVKRSLACDSPYDQPQCSPHRIQSLNGENNATHAEEEQPCKRLRFQTPQDRFPIKPTDHFVTEPADIGRILNVAPLKRKKAKDGAQMFTMEQVRGAVEEAVQRREAELREEYDRKLNQLLQEQFENFTRFNQDYISRQLRRSSADYIS